MKLSTLVMASALALATLPAAAQQRITVNIGSSHPTTNIWAYAMKEVFQPEVDRLLKAPICSAAAHSRCDRAASIPRLPGVCLA